MRVVVYYYLSVCSSLHIKFATIYSCFCGSLEGGNGVLHATWGFPITAMSNNTWRLRFVEYLPIGTVGNNSLSKNLSKTILHHHFHFLSRVQWAGTE